MESTESVPLRPSIKALEAAWSRLLALAERHPRFIALGLLTAITIVAVIRSSMVVDGRRYFWLDDDQMISMRYARNLAEGHGLVWNTAERVEGYTSLAWALVMAGVHRLPLSDAVTSLAMKVVSWGLACWVLLLADRLLLVLRPKPGLSRPAALIALAVCYDLVFWSANGFETPLLTALFLLVLLRLLEESERRVHRVSTSLLIGLLPLARSDAYHLCAALLATSALLRGARYGLLPRLAPACILPVLQLAFRRLYYGDWLPNTYYLKVSGFASLAIGGAEYVKSFAESYSVPLVLLAAGMAWRTDARVRALCLAAGATLGHLLLVGRDVFPHARFLAPWVPVLLVLAADAAARLAGANPRVLVTFLLLLVSGTAIQAGVHGRGSLRDMRSGNGSPEHGLVAGLLVARNTTPDATIAVIAAGNAPYFSRRPAIDLLGKTDAYIAHLPPAEGLAGHAKYDFDYSLSQEPDVVVTPFPSDLIPLFAHDDAQPRFAAALLLDTHFRARYRDQDVALDYLQANGLLFLRDSTTRAEGADRWEMLSIGR